jgi:hypothetical protein
MESNLSRADVAEFLMITHDAAGRFVGQRAVMTLALCSLLNAHTHTHTHSLSLHCDSDLMALGNPWHCVMAACNDLESEWTRHLDSIIDSPPSFTELESRGRDDRVQT